MRGRKVDEGDLAPEFKTQGIFRISYNYSVSYPDVRLSVTNDCGGGTTLDLPAGRAKTAPGSGSLFGYTWSDTVSSTESGRPPSCAFVIAVNGLGAEASINGFISGGGGAAISSGLSTSQFDVLGSILDVKHDAVCDKDPGLSNAQVYDGLPGYDASADRIFSRDFNASGGKLGPPRHRARRRLLRASKQRSNTPIGRKLARGTSFSVGTTRTLRHDELDAAWRHGVDLHQPPPPLSRTHLRDFSPPCRNPVLTEAIDRLCRGEALTAEETTACLREVMEGRGSDTQTAGLLIAFRSKGETVEEIAGMARAMRELAVAVETSHDDLVDTAGTGGGRPTFNVSTTAAFVAAGAGCRIAKHGNRSATGQSGSADVLEALGARIDLAPEAVASCIDELGFGFMFAPAHHPAMKHVVPVRKELAVRTIFNFLGPLTNPAGAEAAADRRLGPPLPRHRRRRAAASWAATTRWWCRATTASTS